MRTKKSGFTLTELLAVVLVIAILTAVAMPQYKRAIRRSEAVESLVSLRNLYDSARRYKMANSAAPTTLVGLDMEFFDAKPVGGGGSDYSVFQIGKFEYSFDNNYVQACRRNTNDYCFQMYYNHGTYGKDALFCVPNTSTGRWLCDALGTTKVGNNYLIE